MGDRSSESTEPSCRRFGRYIQNARKDAGLTQAELAERIGVGGQTTVSAYENGRAWPGTDTFIALVRVRGIDLADFLAVVAEEVQAA